MTDHASTNDPGAAPAVLERLLTQFETGAANRLAHWLGAGDGWRNFILSMETAGYRPALLALGAVGLFLLAFAATALIGRWIVGRGRRGWLAQGLIWLGSGALVMLVSMILATLSVADPRLRDALQNCAGTAVLAAMICMPLGGGRRSIFRPWRRDLAWAVAVAAGGLAVLAWLRIWGAADALRDLFATFAVSLPFTALVATAYIRHRRPIAIALSLGARRGSLRRRLAAAWPWAVVALIVFSFVFLQATLTFGTPTRGGPLLASLLLVLAAPHLDAAIHRLGRRAALVQGREFAGALWGTFRIAVAAWILAILAILWLLPVLDVLGISHGTVALKAVEVFVLVLIVAFFWNWLSILATRIRPAAAADPHMPPVARTRLGTVGPLLIFLAKISLLTLGVLTSLVMVGINVWPLITGLSIFGLAIGLGSQTLVKDVVAGLFFLIDDAFRPGEYIETSGAKGAVEKMSLRSVSLRHPRGAVATIPYGQIGKIQNFSREWVIEKLVFRVALDTDVDLIRKLFKKVGQEVAADPDLSINLIEPFKSQGIAAIEEGTLVIRGKFKARAGRQFMIRKAILSKVMRTLQDNGIKLVPKPLQMPGAPA